MALFDTTTILDAVETGAHEDRTDVSKAFLSALTVDLAKGLFSSLDNTYPELFWDTSRIAFAWGQGGVNAPDIYMQRVSASVLEVKNAANDTWLDMKIASLWLGDAGTELRGDVAGTALKVEASLTGNRGVFMDLYAIGTSDVGASMTGHEVQTTFDSAASGTHPLVIGHRMSLVANTSGSANITHGVGLYIDAPALTDGGSGSIPTGTSLYIAGPAAGAVTNYSFWVDSGITRLDDGVALGGGSSATLGTVGGSGPASVGQAQWLRININGTDHWVPAWT
jgi:hypothetical protein